MCVTELGRLHGRIYCNASRAQSLGACAAGYAAMLPVHRAWAPARQDARQRFSYTELGPLRGSIIMLQRFPYTELGRLRGRIHCNASRAQSLGACAAGYTTTLPVHRAWAPAARYDSAEIGRTVCVLAFRMLPRWKLFEYSQHSATNLVVVAQAVHEASCV